MASWKDLCKHMCLGESAYQIAQKLRLKPSRLARMMASKRLARRLAADERLAVRAAARQAGDAGGVAQPFSTVQNGTVSGLAVPCGAPLCHKMPSEAGGSGRTIRRNAIATNDLREAAGA